MSSLGGQVGRGREVDDLEGHGRRGDRAGWARKGLARASASRRPLSWLAARRQGRRVEGLATGRARDTEEGVEARPDGRARRLGAEG